MTPDLSKLVALLQKEGIDTGALDQRLKRTRDVFLSAAQSTPARLSATPAAVAAATRGCFLPSDLGFATDAEAASEPELADLLAQSELVTVGSQRAWQLKPEARRSVLLQAREQGSLANAIEQPVPVAPERDAQGALLRSALAGTVPDPETMPLEDLEQLATVSEWLGKTGLAKLPLADELRRTLQRRELLEPVRVLVGRPVEAGADGSKDRMVGRVEEMERLRAYVGIVAPDEIRHYVTRTLNSLWSAVTFSDSENEPLLLQGIGGMGKSTLLGKFILDHALIEGFCLPFVYLDFDRAALAPRQPLQLLIDIALQLGLWIPALEPKLRELRAQLRAAIDVQAASEERRRTERSTHSELKVYCEKLRVIVEKFNEGRAPFLLLFDTFEVVQYDEEAVSGVTSLISALRRPQAEDWSKLRIVVAGRADMPEITTSHEPIVLGPLSLSATKDLIRLRNRTEQLGLTESQIGVLAKPLRNSPLDVIIVTNWLEGRQPEERAKLVDEIMAEVTTESATVEDGKGGPLATQRITGILIKRMINHINDPHVRVIANPGLVVRAVTPKVIRQVMAPASGLVTRPDELPEGAEDELFRRLARERWLVTLSGSAVRHRPEVRLAMLDLMRRDKREAFDKTNRMAIDYFRPLAATDKEARAEAVYHMLLAKEPLEKVDKLWTSDIGASLAGAVDDLEGLAQDYLKAKLGRSVALEVMASLPVQTILSVLRYYGLRILARAVPSSFIDLVLKPNPAVDEDPSVLGLKTEALYRAGRWNALLELAERALDAPLTELERLPATGTSRLHELLLCFGEDDFARMRLLDKELGYPLRFLLRWAARDPSDYLWDRLEFDLALRTLNVAEAIKQDDLYWDFAALAASKDSRRAGAARLVIEDVAERCRSDRRLPDAAGGSGALRVLAFFEDRKKPAIIRRIDFKSHFSTICWAERQLFGDLLAVARRAAPAHKAVKQGQKLFEELGRYARDMVIADVAITQKFAAVVGDLVEIGSPDIDRAVLRILALTHADWIEPLGHALTAAYGGEEPDQLGWLSSIKIFGGRRSSRQPSSGHDIMARADEAGRLRDTVTAYVKRLPRRAKEARDFLALAKAFGVWHEMLQKAANPKAKKA